MNQNLTKISNTCIKKIKPCIYDLTRMKLKTEHEKTKPTTANNNKNKTKMMINSIVKVIRMFNKR